MSARPTSRFSYDRSAALYVAATLVLGIGSLHSQNNLLFLVFGVAVGVLLVNGAYAWASLSRLRVQRSAPARGEAGRPMRLRYSVRTTSRFLPAGALLLSEVDAGGAQARPASVVSVSRRSPATTIAELVPDRRGELALDRIDVSTRFPFGAVKKTARFRRPATALIHPRSITPPRSVFQAAAATARDDRSLNRAGTGDEFFGLREYRDGDQTRDIAWRPSARHGQWVVRVQAQQASTPVRLGLALRPELGDEANEDAIALAAGTLRLARRLRTPVALCDPASPSRLIDSLTGALDALARVDARSRVATGEGATVVAEAAPDGPRLRPARREAGAPQAAGAAP